MKFGETLRQLLEAYEWTPKELSEALHIPLPTLEDFLLCQQEPNFDTLKRIATYFDVSTDELLDYHGVPHKSEGQMEGELLQAFSDMPPIQQRIFLEQGKVVVRILGQEAPI